MLPNPNVSRLVWQLSLPNPLKSGIRVENENVFGAVPTDDAPTSSERSTILLPTKVRRLDVIDVLRYIDTYNIFWLWCPHVCMCACVCQRRYQGQLRRHPCSGELNR